jgi:hypothetical protein
MARPLKNISSQELMALMRMKPSLRDTAAFFGVSEDTIERHVSREYEMSFAEFREAHMVECRHELIRKAYSMALGGDRAMLTLCLKHMCGWTEKSEVGNPNLVEIKLAYEPAVS